MDQKENVVTEAALCWKKESGSAVSLDTIKTCMMNTFRMDAGTILRSVDKGEISENDAVCIARAERLIIDFVDRDYYEHFEEYDGCLPIWGDDWDYITGFLVDKVENGMDGSSILSAINLWIEKGAYHNCTFEDALETEALSDVSLQGVIEDAERRRAAFDEKGKDAGEKCVTADLMM